jgi:tRNA (cytidine32/uridine32-2'-O)-methyltransferase
MLERIRIVMVGTTHPGNIGAAARAMKTMGLSDLCLVAPKQFPCAEASSLASGATDLLGQARVCESLDDALADCTMVVGTSARQRHVPWPCVTPRQLGGALVTELERQEQGRVAILFGREDRGLTNDELQRCNWHVTIPANVEYGVLNVAAAIQVLCYEMRLAVLGDDIEVARPDARSRQHSMPLPEVVWDEPLATSEALEGMLVHLGKVAVRAGFLDPQQPAMVMKRLRRLFLRARPDKMEASILRGILSSLDKQLDRLPDDE